MLNLSDKELDRLSREAANEHDPGDLSTPGSWEKLELRLDTELGKVHPNPFGGIIRRISFYYAPVILLIVGVSYYFAKYSKNNTNSTVPAGPPVTGKTEPTPSPPQAVVKTIAPGKKGTDQLPNTQNNSNKATSTPDSSTANYHDSNTDLPSASNPGYPGAAGTVPAGAPIKAPADASIPHSAGSDLAAPAAPGAAHRAPTTIHQAPANSGSADANTPPSDATMTHPGTITDRPAGKDRRLLAQRHEAAIHTGKIPSGRSSTMLKPGSKYPGTKNPDGKYPGDRYPGDKSPGDNNTGENSELASSRTITPTPAREPALSVIPGPQSLVTQPVVDDSALRNFTVNTGNKKADPIGLGKKNSKSLHYSRPLQIGISIAPDFTTVKSNPSDKPGSIFGITLGYQFMNKLSVNTGILLTQKNYDAPGNDFHAPSNSWINTASNVDLDQVKGHLSMLEIPLNLRYDVNTAGNTLFYVSGGLSSYILKNENCVYYYQRFGVPRRSPGSPAIAYGAAPPGNDPTNKKFYPFATINLGVGVEAIISNSFSIQLEPYAKIPLSGVGYGQVQFSSFGINFALKYAPLLKKSRH